MLLNRFEALTATVEDLVLELRHLHERTRRDDAQPARRMNGMPCSLGAGRTRSLALIHFKSVKSSPGRMNLVFSGTRWTQRARQRKKARTLTVTA